MSPNKITWVLVVGIVLIGGLCIQKNRGICGLVGAEGAAGKNYDASYCDRSCNVDSDCEYSCGCGAISKNETCHTEGIIFDCVDHYVKCEKGGCVAGEEKVPAK